MLVLHFASRVRNQSALKWKSVMMKRKQNAKAFYIVEITYNFCSQLSLEENSSSLDPTAMGQP